MNNTKTISKVCKECNQQFTFQAGQGKCHRVYCSEKCRMERRRLNSIRKKNCEACGDSFEYRTGRGVDRKYCQGKECQSKRREESTVARLKEITVLCPCGKLANRIKAGLCEACYGRLRIHGDTKYHKRRPTYRYSLPSGYVKRYLPNHPLSDSSGHVFEHRMILHDRLKEQNLCCYWCFKPLTWKALVCDHLNEDKADNREDNLVPSCNGCNIARGAMLTFSNRVQGQRFTEAVRRLVDYHLIKSAKEGKT